MKKNIYIIIAVVVFLFYWFQVRPELKTKKCLAKAQDNYMETWNKWDEDGDGKLPSRKAEDLSNMRKESMDRCIKIYN